MPSAHAGPPRLQEQCGKRARVLIPGAGIAGLVCAYELRKAGYRVTVLEARERPGGRVFTVRRGSVIEERDSRQRVDWDDDPDLYFDAGAARLPQHHQAIIGYAREFGVQLEVMSNENRNALLQSKHAFQGQAVPHAKRRRRCATRTAPVFDSSVYVRAPRASPQHVRWMFCSPPPFAA